MIKLIELCADGLAVGAAYALIALGFVIIYRASGVFNFAHGEFLTVGAFTMVAAHSAGLPWPVALLAGMLVTGVIAAGIERAVIRPMVGRPVFVTIILTIFVAYLVRAAVVILLGAEVGGVPTPWDTLGTVSLGGAIVTYHGLASMAAAAIALVAFFLVLKYTRLGIGMRATSGDQEVALALGVPVGRVFGATWFLAGMYAAVAGVFLAILTRTVDTNLGFLALRAFPAVIVGGLTSPLGTVLAALLLGVAEKLAEAYLGPMLGGFGYGFHTVVTYVIMILFLVLRPYGLLGTRQVERV